MKTVTRRTSAAVMLVSILLAVAVLPVYAQESTPPTIEMAHRVALTEYGLVAVNETIGIINSGPNPVTLPTLELTYDSIRAEDISAYAAKGPVGLDLDKENVGPNAKLTVSPKAAYQIQSGFTEAIHIILYLPGLVSTDGAIFQAKVPVVPSLNYKVKEMRSSILLPTRAMLNEPLSGFSVASTGDSEVWSRSLFNVSAIDMRSQVLRYTADVSYPLSILRFPNVERTFTVGIDGSVTVRDDIQVANMGGGALTNMSVSLLNKGISNVVVAPTSEPPLINRFTASLTDKKLNLKEVYGIPLQKGGKINIMLEYPLPAAYSTSKGGSILFKVPMEPPVTGVVERFKVKIAAAPGIAASNTEVVRLNAPPVGDDAYSFEVSPGVAWASSGIIPVATLVFVVVLLALMSGRVGLGAAEEEEKEAVKMGDLASIFEEKTTSTSSILDSLQAKGAASRGDLLKSGEEMEALKSRVASRFGELRPKILSVRPDLKERLTELSNIDREYNRAASDLFNLYDQYYTGRMRRSTFEDLAKRYRRRLEQAEERLTDIVEQLRGELER